MLLQQMRQESAAAFTQLYHHYSPQLYLKIFLLIKDRELAEELTQELFTRIWQRKNAIEDNQNFAGYLATIATHLVLDTFRKIKRDKTLREKWKAIAEEHYAHIEESIDYKESQQQFQHAIETLPPQQFKAYQLCRVEGCSYKEAANLMGISMQTVKEYLAQANKTIRAYMMNHPDSAVMLLVLLLM